VPAAPTGFALAGQILQCLQPLQIVFQPRIYDTYVAYATCALQLFMKRTI